MKLPIEVSAQIYKERGTSLGYGAIVRDCAKVVAEHYTSAATRREVLDSAANAILSRYGLEPEKDHD